MEMTVIVHNILETLTENKEWIIIETFLKIKNECELSDKTALQ